MSAMPDSALADPQELSARFGEGDRPIRPKVITDSGDCDHADYGRKSPA
jgi:hypothetical protein